MIEVEHYRIGLTAIDARVRQKIREQQSPILDAVAVDACDLAADVVLAIRQVVRASIRGLTLPAMALSGSLRDVIEGELPLGLGLAAHVASEHGCLPRDRGAYASGGGPLEHLF